MPPMTIIQKLLAWHWTCQKALPYLFLLALVLSSCSNPNALPTVVANKNLPINVAPVSRALDQKGSIPQAGQQAPEFSYTTIDGVEHKLSELKGRMVVLNFWATWCEPCKQEMPALDRINDKYGDQIIVLGVNKLESTDTIAEFAASIGVKFPLISNPKGDIPELYGVRNLPTTYFILPDGQIGQWQPGGLNEDEMIGIIQKLQGK